MKMEMMKAAISCLWLLMLVSRAEGGTQGGKGKGPGPAEDPCEKKYHHLLIDTHGLYSAGLAAPKNKVTCQRLLPAHWYRMQSPAGNDMPMECVEMFHCRTRFPIWLRDPIPAEDGQVHQLRAVITNKPCIALADSSSRKISIRVKNCGDFRVYYLVPTPLCYAAYCFGRNTKCPPGQGSATGFSPGCTATQVTFKADLEVRVTPKVVGLEHVIEFECAMSNIKLGSTTEADIEYYGEWFITKSGISKLVHSDIYDGPITVGQNILLPYKGLNIDIHCQVQAQPKGGGPPTQFSVSSKYFVGAKYEPRALVFPHTGAMAPVKIILTVPFLCSDPDFQCHLWFEIVITNGQKKVCKNKPPLLGTAQPDCKAGIVGLLPGKPYPTTRQEAGFQVHANAVNVLTGGTYSMDLYLKTQSVNFDHPIWESYQMPALTVTVVDKLRPGVTNQLASSFCYANNDPHMRTFDGCRYENQVHGEFVLYRHKVLPYQVNIFTARCNPKSSRMVYCTQAVAIMSGRTHYIWDKTGGIPGRDSYLDCDENDLTFHVHGTTKTVTFKTGTKVQITRYTGRYTNVRIVPSIYDVGQTEGLCQMLDGIKEVTLTGRDGSTTPCPAAGARYKMTQGLIMFVNTWKASEGDSLYNQNPKLYAPMPNHPGVGLCDCPACKDPIKGCSEAKCDNSKWTTDCNPVGTNVNKVYDEQCRRIIHNRRRKRETDEFIQDDYNDNVRPTFSREDVIHKIATPKGRGPFDRPLWTSKKAEVLCKAAIMEGKAGETCTKLENVDYEAALQNCITDIVLTDSADWLEDAVDSMKADCEIEAIHNFSRWQNVSDGEELIPPVAIMDIICPGNCSVHGVCVNGECECEAGYGDKDCSVDLSEPLSINIRGLQRVECDRSRRRCQKVALTAENFVDSPDLLCQLGISQISSEGVIPGEEMEMVKAEFLHREEIMCPLPRPGLGQEGPVLYAHLYNIRVTNNRDVYSNSVWLLSYDKRCLKCDFENCEVKEKWCFIDNTCYREGDLIPNQPGEPCIPSVPQKSTPPITSTTQTSPPTTPISIKTGVGLWSAWEPCDRDCGGGITTRSRACNGCAQPTQVDEKMCNRKPCPANMP